MSPTGKALGAGRAWSDPELDAIVRDYFAMLQAELTRHAYVKTEHSTGLLETIDRSPGSIEYKHQNISAVLEELGLPRIAGYKPMRNYQKAIIVAVDRYLSRNPAILQWTPGRGTGQAVSAADVFVGPPPTLEQQGDRFEGILQLVGKFDPVERDFRNRKLGREGEEFVVGVERRRLEAEGRRDLAKRVRWVSQEQGDGAGYDVLSFTHEGQDQLLEVKTTNGPARTPFFISRNEIACARERAADWKLYRVHEFAADPRIFSLTAPLEDSVALSPEVWLARLRAYGVAAKAGA